MVLLVHSDPIDAERHSLPISGEIRGLKSISFPANVRLLRPPTWENFLNVTSSHHFDVIHFVGHGNEDGLVMEREDGRANFISKENLAKILSSTIESVVLLSCCDSWGPASYLADTGVSNVFAFKNSVPNETASGLTEQFYNLLFGNKHSCAEIARIIQRRVDLLYGDDGLIQFKVEGPDVNEERGTVFQPLRDRMEVEIDLGEAPSNLPFGSLVGFVGRGTDMYQKIFPKLSDPSLQAIALIGIPGIGKSSLAIAAAHRYSFLFPDGVIFSSAKGKSDFSLEDILYDIAEVLKVEVFTGDIGRRSRAAIEAINIHRVLLILDNAETIKNLYREEILGFLNRIDVRSGSKILITADGVLEEFRSLIHKGRVNIRPMSHRDLRKLVVTELRDNQSPLASSKELIDAIENHVHGHPLLTKTALDLYRVGTPVIEIRDLLLKSGGPFSKLRLTFERYCNEIRRRQPEVLFLLRVWPCFRNGARDLAWCEVAQRVAVLTLKEHDVQSGLLVIRESSLFDVDIDNRFQANSALTKIISDLFFNNLPISRQKEIVQCFVDFYLQFAKSVLKGQNPFAKLRDDHDNLVHAIDLANRYGFHDALFEIGHSLYKYFDVRGHWSTWEWLIELCLVASDLTDRVEEKAHFLYYRAELRKRRAEFQESLTDLSHAKSLASHVGDGQLLARIELQSGMVMLPLGESAGAEKLILNAIGLLAQYSDFKRMAKGFRALAEFSLNTGNLAKMEEYAHESLRIEEVELKSIQDFGVAASLKLLGELKTASGDLHAAKVYLDRCEPVLRDSVDASRQLYAELLYAKGVHALACGDCDQAIANFKLSLDISDGLGLAHKSLQTKKALADIERLRHP